MKDWQQIGDAARQVAEKLEPRVLKVTVHRVTYEPLIFKIPISKVEQEPLVLKIEVKRAGVS